MINFHNTNILIISLIPLLLISGPFLPDLFATYLGIFFIIYSIKKKNFNYFKNYFFLFFLFVYFYLNINSIFSFNPSISFQSSATYFRVILFIFCISFYVKKNTKLFNFFYFFSFFSFLLLFVDSIIQVKTGFNILNIKLDQTLRVSSFFGEELIMGSFVSRLLPVLIGISYILNNTFKIQYINFILILISGVLVVLSAERLAFFYYLFFLALYCILNFNKKNLLFILILIFALLSSFIINKNSYQRIILHTQNQLKESKSFIGFSERHVMHYLVAINMFLDNKILGHGLKSFRNLCSEQKYLQKTYETKFNDYKISEDKGYMQFFKIKDLKKANMQFKRILRINYDNGKNEEIPIKYNLFFFEKNKKIFYEKIIDWDQANYGSSEIVKNGHIFLEIITSKQKYYFDKGDILFINYNVGGACNTHPHNIYLQFLSELGLIGFLLFFAIFIYVSIKLFIIFFKSLKSSVSDQEKAKFFVLVSVFLSMFPFVPSGSYFNNWMLVISYLPIGIFLGLHDSSK